MLKEQGTGVGRGGGGGEGWQGRATVTKKGASGEQRVPLAWNTDGKEAGRRLRAPMAWFR